MTDIQAAIGVEQLKRLDDLLARRRAVAGRYNDAFACRGADSDAGRAGIRASRVPVLSDSTPARLPRQPRRDDARARRARRVVPAGHSADSPRAALPRPLRNAVAAGHRIGVGLVRLPADVRVAFGSRPGARHRRRHPHCDPLIMARPLLAIVVPVLNERDNLARFHDEVVGGHARAGRLRLGVRLRGRRQPGRIVRHPAHAATHATTGCTRCPLSAQLRQPRRHRRRHRPLARRRRRHHGGRPPGSARAHSGVRRPLARGLRRRLGRAQRPGRRSGARVGDGPVLHAGAAVRDSDLSERRNRQLLSDRETGDGRVPPDERAQSPDVRPDRVGGVPGDAGAVPPSAAVSSAPRRGRRRRW